MKNLLILFSFLIPLGSLAQNQEERNVNSEFVLPEFAPIYMSYYGNFITHPGVKLGFDWNLLIIEKKKCKKTIRKILMVSPSLSFYNHKASHKGLLISTDISWRRYSKNLFFIETSLGVGYFRKFNSGETWEVNSDGTVSNIGITSRGYFAPSVSFAYGKRFSVKESFPISVFTKLNVNIITGYNAGVVPEVSLDLGVRMELDWGIKRGEVKTIIKNGKL